VAKLTTLTHKIVIQQHLVAESCTICSSCSRQPTWKLLDTPSYFPKHCVYKHLYLCSSPRVRDHIISQAVKMHVLKKAIKLIGLLVSVKCDHAYQ